MDISKIILNTTVHPLVKRSSLCKTLGGHECVLLEVTEPTNSKEQYLARRGVVITARCHPGETPPSFILRGILDFLTSSNPAAAKLRQMYVFKLIPMMNPDGVVSGNSRSTLEGADLNRMWQEPNPQDRRRDFKILAAIKKLISDFTSERKVPLVLDLHAHSRRCNIFAYGCRPSKGVDFADKQLSGFERVFPKMISQFCAAFKYSGCSYKLKKSKEGTERITIHRDYGVRGMYTIEASFLGGDNGTFKGLHYTIADYEKFGVDICHAMLEYSDADKVKCVLETVQREADIDEDAEDSDDSDYSSEGDSDDEAIPASPRELQGKGVMSQILELAGTSGSRPARRTSLPAAPRAPQLRPKKKCPPKTKPEKGAVKSKADEMVSSSLGDTVTCSDEPIRASSAVKHPEVKRSARVNVERREPQDDVHAHEEDTADRFSRVGSAPEVYSSYEELAGERETSQNLGGVDSTVLDRIRNMREQWDGIHEEFAVLQGRVKSYDGYTEKIFKIPPKTDD